MLVKDKRVLFLSMTLLMIGIISNVVAQTPLPPQPAELDIEESFSPIPMESQSSPVNPLWIVVILLIVLILIIFFTKKLCEKKISQKRRRR